MSRSLLLQLADAFEIETEYEDVDGVHHVADPEALVAVVQALGGAIDDAGGAGEALRYEIARRHRQVLEPFTALTQGAPPAVRLRLPAAVDPDRCHLEITDEEGTTYRRPVGTGQPLGTTSQDGTAVIEYDLPLTPDGAPLPSGYYELVAAAPGRVERGRLVVAPTCPVPARSWGGFLPLPALRTGDDWGVGSYGDLGRLAGWVAEQGGSILGTLPLYPAFLLDEPFEPSPYLPVTRLGWNELFIDPREVPEASGERAQGLLSSPGVAHAVERLRRGTSVDYRDAMRVHRSVLEVMAESVTAGSSRRRHELVAFADRHPELVAYAAFRSAQERGQLPDPGCANADVASLDVAGRYHLYVQWVAETQLAEIGDSLYLDLPVGVHPLGFDPWREPDLFVDGVEGGAPPDAFFATGQSWGFRPLHPRAVRDQGYRYPVACLRHIMRRASVVRIDHVMGLHRLYWVPDGFDAVDGVYVRYRLDEMLAVIALEADRTGTAVVGEDLGTVPDEVRAGMERSRMLRSWVFEFEATADVPTDPPELSLASIGTHDLPRFAAFWEGNDIDDLAARGVQTEEWARFEYRSRLAWRASVEVDLAPDSDARAALRSALVQLAGGPARLVLVDLEDLWLERQPVNRPGSDPSWNWRARSRYTVSEFEGRAEVLDLLETIDQARRPVRTWPGKGDR